jgi:hypothetical protein
MARLERLVAFGRLVRLVAPGAALGRALVTRSRAATLAAGLLPTVRRLRTPWILLVLPRRALIAALAAMPLPPAYVHTSVLLGSHLHHRLIAF